MPLYFSKKPIFVIIKGLLLMKNWIKILIVSLSAGYSFMRGSKTMEYLKRTDGNRLLQWAWLSLGFSPTLFKK